MKEWIKANQYLVRAWFWIAAIVPTIIWLKESILWVALMSLYANIETAFGAHEARKARKERE
jgi:hypothetical protein